MDFPIAEGGRITGTRIHGKRLSAVINEIAPVSQFLEDSIRLLSEIYLESDMVYNFVLLMRSTRDTTSDGDDGDEVNKCAATFSVIDDAGLTFLVGGKAFPQMRDGFRGSVLSVLALLHNPGGTLEEPTIFTKDFPLFIPRETAKCR